MSEPQKSKIIVDSEWKSRVESEKETIKRQEQEPPQHALELPPASFPMLVSTLVTQALVGLGQLPDPLSGHPELNLPVASHFIDTLAVLEQKTKGNLSAEESSMLTDVLHQLRMAFVSMQGGPPPKSTSSSIEIP
jgi:uncharacterized protein DUF1844